MKKTTPTTLEHQISEAALAAGITRDEAHAALGGAGAERFGDGAFLGKFLEFLKLIIPVLLPIIAAKTDE